MENSFLAGSENLYKYLVTMGLLLMVLTVYYPLKETQDLELKTTELESEAKKLEFVFNQNYKSVQELEKRILKEGKSEAANLILKEIISINNENNIKQLESERMSDEIEIRKSYIKFYRTIFWIFFPIGFILACFGFFKWKKSKKNDDKISELECEKLELEVKKLREE
ncbi:hypothetical protein [Acidiluteibacter ferrifornacis]|uniref:Uncharacterized protein n=1 Tax=Acidiluteibacter ferrifornacis TaxID=2692424 RepID=A0A6N9NG39_9FLAO|nr:hypothetical protein [Acidiluteibacter ferrifornacis]NBG65596.1 hypothetical protein [Acidiluteibacter ferrifornacis]